MIKRILMTAMLATSVAGVLAAPITPGEALARLKNSNHAPARLRGVSAADINIRAYKSDNNLSQLYLCEMPGDAGYMILSGDDLGQPLLAYAETGAFPSESEMSPQMKAWLDGYIRELDYINEHQPKRHFAPKREVRAAIAPMLRTKWDQGAPYNNKCPIIQKKRAYTGCVATAMAQVMKYHQFPAQATGKITYYCSTIGKNISLDFSTVALNWNDMLDIYGGEDTYTEEQATAVAELMKACGYSVEMSYSPSGSGAVSVKIANAMVEYFGYSEGITYERRDCFTTDQWETMIYDNLAQGLPLVYDGQAATGGHSFVCDGYDGQGLYHFNWGWSGYGDGYFVLSALDPLYEGAGGFAGGYNYMQDAVFGIRPPREGDKPAVRRLTQDDTLSFETDGQNVTLKAGWYNLSGFKANMNVGIEMTALNADGSLTGTVTMLPVEELDNSLDEVVEVENMYGFSEMHFNIGDLADGDYIGQLVTRDPAASAEWFPARSALAASSKFKLHKTGAEFELTEIEGMAFEISEIELLSDVYFGSPIKFKAKLHNPTQYTLTMGVGPVMADEDDELLSQGLGGFATVGPGETADMEFVSTLSYAYQIKEPTTAYLWLYDPNIGFIYDCEPLKVTINPATTYSCESLGVSVVGGNEVVNPNRVEIEATLRVTEGYMAASVYLAIAEANGDGLTVSNYGQSEPVFAGKGETAIAHGQFAIPGAQPGVDYYALLCKVNGNSLTFFETDESGFAAPSCYAVFRVVVTGVGESTTGADWTLSGYTLTAGENKVDVYSVDGRHVCSVEPGKSAIVESGIHVIVSSVKSSKVAVK